MIAAEQLNHLNAARQALIGYGALAGNDAQAASRAMRIAALSLRLNDPASAVRWLQNAADANPSDTKVLAALADAQLRTGDSNRARETIARGLLLDAENPTLLTMSRRANVPTSKTSK